MPVELLAATQESFAEQTDYFARGIELPDSNGDYAMIRVVKSLSASVRCVVSYARLFLLGVPLGASFTPYVQAEYKLLVSDSADRSSAMTLDGNAVNGSIHVFVSPERGVDQVQFALNDQPVRTEFWTPYDFAATAPDGMAYPFDSASLPNGVHTISAVISRIGGGSEITAATFIVDNGSPIYDLMVSTAPDRSSPVALEGQSVSGNIFVFVSPASNVSRVDFSLDGALVQTEHYPAYDLAGTASGNLAKPFDSMNLPDGPHTVTASITREDGKRVVATSTFIAGGLDGWEGNAAAQVDLNWIPPSKRSDGTALSLGDIAGYILHMNGRVLIDDIPADAVALTVDIPALGEYCFAMATRDLAGRVGPFSDSACWSVFAAPGG